MHAHIGKILSLVIALVFAVLLFVDQRGVTPRAFQGCAYLLLPLALIWFADELGSFTGGVGRGGNINTSTPPLLVAAAGWFFLVALPLLIYLLR